MTYLIEAGENGLDPCAWTGHAAGDMSALRKSPAGFPMAPSVEEWEALSPADRAAVVELLPGEVTYDEMAMPEGDIARIGPRSHDRFGTSTLNLM